MPSAKVILIALAAIFAINEAVSESNDAGWIVDDVGFLKYSSAGLATPNYYMNQIESDSSLLYEIKIESQGDWIVGLLRIPNFPEDSVGAGRGIPGIILLPGATVSKEAEQGLAKRLSDLGYASLTLDQRNLGVTDIQEDMQLFLQGKEPEEHAMVYDAIAAAQVLRNLPKIDPERIAYLGESNGGRTAIVACALDRKAIGVVAISTCGYGTIQEILSGTIKDGKRVRFYRSVDPETYLDLIPPRTLVMINSKNDTIVPYEGGVQTYQLASSPKFLITTNCKKHGYCEEMADGLKEKLSYIMNE